MVSNSPSNKKVIPTDEELLQIFLFNKIHNKPIPTNLKILEYDLYGEKNPWEIWEEFGGSHSYGGKDLYFFTILKKKSSISSRLLRTIGLGSWEGENTGKLIFAKGKDSKSALGIKKRFHFAKSNTYQDGGWLLHEYSLNISLTGDPSYSNNVLCRFRKNLKHAKRNTGSEISLQASQRINTEVLGCPLLPNPCDNVLSIEDILHDMRDQLYHEEEDDVQIINNEEFIFSTQKRTIVLGLAATTNNNKICWRKNIQRASRKQPDGGDNTDAVSQKRKQPHDGDNIDVAETSTEEKANNNKEQEDNTDVAETSTEEKAKNNKEQEDGHLTMSWPGMFAEADCEWFTKDEEIQMLPNDFAKDILSEYINIK